MNRPRALRASPSLLVLTIAAAALAACASAGSGGGEARRTSTAASSTPESTPDRPATASPTSLPGASREGSSYRVYVGAESADAVMVVEGGTWQVVKTIPVGISMEDIEGVHALRVSPDGEHWYISLAHGWPYGTLWKFTTAGDSLAGKTELGNFPATIGLTPDGAWAFVVNYNLHGDKAIDTVSAVYTATMTEVVQIPACVKPHGLDVSDDGRFVLVTCTRDDTILKIDVGTLKEAMRGSVRLPEEEAAGKDCYPTGVQAMPDGSRAYVSCGHANEVRVVDLATLGVSKRIAECKGAYLLQLDPEARRLWVPCRGGQEVIVIDTGTDEIVGRIATTREFPHTVAFTPDGAHALLTQESRGVIPGAMDVVDRESLEKLTSVDIGLQATGIGVAPGGAPTAQ